MSYSELLDTYGITILPKENALVFDAIPSGVTMLLKNPVASETSSVSLDPVKTNIFRKYKVFVPYVVSYWNNLVPNLNWRKIWCLPSKYIIVNKLFIDFILASSSYKDTKRISMSPVHSVIIL